MKKKEPELTRGEVREVLNEEASALFSKCKEIFNKVWEKTPTKLRYAAYIAISLPLLYLILMVVLLVSDRQDDTTKTFKIGLQWWIECVSSGSELKRDTDYSILWNFCAIDSGRVDYKGDIIYTEAKNDRAGDGS